jgi:nucleotide-binding universal stress UspA family protein
LLTENYTSYNKLLVPTDFSAHSKEAIEWAIQFAQLASIPYISLLHIIETSFRDTLKSYEPKKYIGLIKENATNELNNILNTINTKDIKIDRILEINDTIESGIQQTCREKKIDLIVIAARGTSSGISIFLGSVADKLVEISNIPILVVKKKGTGTSVLETLFKMF